MQDNGYNNFQSNFIEESMSRLTEEQSRLCDAMAQLIDLYYQFKETDNKDWFSKPVVKAIAKIFGLIVPNFSPCLFFQEGNYFRYRGAEERISLKRSDFDVFLKFMNALREDVKNKIKDIFKIEEAIYETHLRSQSSKLKNVGPHKYKQEDKFYTAPKLSIVSPLPENADQKLQSEYLNKRGSLVLNDPPIQHESFKFSGNFDSKLFEIFFPERGERISSPGYFNSKMSFIKVIIL
jgi:hypothetical protein